MSSPQVTWNDSHVQWDEPAPNPNANSSITGQPIAPASHDFGGGTGEISAPQGGTNSWLSQLEQDVRHGSGATFPGRVLSALGAKGTDQGVSQGAADTAASIPLGAIRTAQGVASSWEHPIAGPLKAIGGVLQMGTLPLAFAGGPAAPEAAESILAKSVGRLSNAVDVPKGSLPDVQAQLQTALPALKAAGHAPQNSAQMVDSLKNVSQGIDSQIQGIIQPNAAADVSHLTKPIADQMRASITPQMQEINKGTSNVISKFADSIENAKNLGDLDEVRKQISDRLYATRGNAVSAKYLHGALESVRDAIATKAQDLSPGTPVRELRSQQAAMMKLQGVFEDTAAARTAQAAAQGQQASGMTTLQKALSAYKTMKTAVTNPQDLINQGLHTPQATDRFVKSAFNAADTPALTKPGTAPRSEHIVEAFKQAGVKPNLDTADYQQAMQETGGTWHPGIGERAQEIKAARLRGGSSPAQQSESDVEMMMRGGNPDNPIDNAIAEAKANAKPTKLGYQDTTGQRATARAESKLVPPGRPEGQ